MFIFFAFPKKTNQKKRHSRNNVFCFAKTADCGLNFLQGFGNFIRPCCYIEARENTKFEKIFKM